LGPESCPDQLGHLVLAQPDLMRRSHMRDLRDLEQPPQAVPAEPEPAVPVRRSVGKDHLICLVCGQKQKTLKRDLAVRHELSSADPRGLYDLSSDYPLVARSYAAQRSELARRTGLGRKPAPAAPAATARMRGATRQKGPRLVIACHSVSKCCGMLRRSPKEHGVLRLGLVVATRARPLTTISATMLSMRSVLLSLAAPGVAGDILGDRDLGGPP
jgi:predicted transcriptional regulator